MDLKAKISVSDFFRKIKYSKQFRFYLAALILLIGLFFTTVYLLTFLIRNLNIGLSQKEPVKPSEAFAVQRFEQLGIIKK